MLKNSQHLPEIKPQFLLPYQQPKVGFYRLWDIIGDPEATPPIQALIPIGRTTFLNGVKSGKYPASVKLSERTVAWKIEDIHALIISLGTDDAASQNLQA